MGRQRAGAEDGAAGGDKLRSLEFSRGGDKVGFVALTGGAEPWCEVRAFTTDREDPVTGSLNGTIDL
ncbi:hypothetical protein [Corynebacterium urinipleomorphum]|uniref:hypothetical protein n=1 Tax=Corynebacterium urinipleomorphum TaxID=1852380 RepID=UPI001178951A|nr:hypothetical protein [Corynebacterium urinipleomorphum]